MKIAKSPRFKRRKIIIFSGVLILLACLIAVFFRLALKTNYELSASPTFEINSAHTVKDLFRNTDNDIIENAEQIIDTTKLGQFTQKVRIRGTFNSLETHEITYMVTDTVSPTIEGDDSLTIFQNDAFEPLINYQFQDNSNGPISSKIEGECDTQQLGECQVKIIAHDESGNQTVKEITIKITQNPNSQAEEPQPQTQAQSQPSNQSQYLVKVNRSQNTVMVYALGEDGTYTDLAKTFVASTGKAGDETPLGTFTASDRYPALLLVGNVWGRYAVRINGHYFFHSVPYFSKGNPSWNNLEYLEYNKLGEGASAGCVRLSVRDAKWIYDNIPAGTTVEIYDSNTLPANVTKPTPIKIDENSPNRGWDPTDSELPKQ